MTTLYLGIYLVKRDIHSANADPLIWCSTFPQEDRAKIEKTMNHLKDKRWVKSEIIEVKIK